MSAALMEAALAALRPRIGETFGPSGWITVTQAMIDAFAMLTDDRQFIHVDPEAARATPFGTTVAHGFLTLSLLPRMARGLLPSVPGRSMGINYGFEKLRFIAPVRSGARLRGLFRLVDASVRPPASIILRMLATIEIEGETRLALSAEWLTLAVLAEPPARPRPEPAG